MRDNIIPSLAIVVPCYNEEAMLPHSIKELISCLDQLKNEGLISAQSYLFCVDDGSHDNTWEIIQSCHALNSNVKGLKLTKNVGHQNALLAGLLSVKDKADCVVSIDADLQDD